MKRSFQKQQLVVMISKNTTPHIGGRLTGIQYLRGVAVILVVLSHAEGIANLDKYFGTLAWNGILTRGTIGVDLFFVISGFIIAHVALKRNTLEPRLDIASFLKKRAVRILPFMWLCIIGYSTLRYLGRGSFAPLPYLKAMVLWPIGDIAPNAIWTLRHEMLFYCTFAVSILVLWRPLKWLLLIYFLSPLFYWGIYVNFAGSTSLWADFFFSRVNMLFGCGYLLGICFLMYPQLRATKVLPHWVIVALSGPLLLAYSNIYGQLFGATRQVLLTGAMSLFIVFCSLIVNTRSSLTIFELLGNASYSIYLTHSAFLSASLGVMHSVMPMISVKMAITVAVIFTVILGFSVHLFVERPLILKLSRWRYSR